MKENVQWWVWSSSISVCVEGSSQLWKDFYSLTGAGPSPGCDWASQSLTRGGKSSSFPGLLKSMICEPEPSSRHCLVSTEGSRQVGMFHQSILMKSANCLYHTMKAPNCRMGDAGSIIRSYVQYRGGERHLSQSSFIISNQVTLSPWASPTLLTLGRGWHSQQCSITTALAHLPTKEVHHRNSMLCSMLWAFLSPLLKSTPFLPTELQLICSRVFTHSPPPSFFPPTPSLPLR